MCIRQPQRLQHRPPSRNAAEGLRRCGACVFDNGGVFWSAVNVAAAVTGGRSENPAAEDSGSYNAERTK
jgi:hypothetical protein